MQTRYPIIIHQVGKQKAMNLNRHIWEGWTAQDFIDELEPEFNRIMDNAHAFQTSFMSNDELKAWCKDNQPYYKKHIPEVYGYFKNRMKQFNHV